MDATANFERGQEVTVVSLLGMAAKFTLCLSIKSGNHHTMVHMSDLNLMRTNDSTAVFGSEALRTTSLPLHLEGKIIQVAEQINLMTWGAVFELTDDSTIHVYCKQANAITG